MLGGDLLHIMDCRLVYREATQKFSRNKAPTMPLLEVEEDV